MILDSSILVATEQKRFDLSSFLVHETSSETVLISSITASELLHGVHRATRRRAKIRKESVEAVFLSYQVLPFDLPCVRLHSKIWSDLKAVGRMIGLHDLLIAATCLRHDFRLATLNEGEFQRVENLRLANARPYLI